MNARRRHIAEMQIVVAKGCTLEAAKAELARIDWLGAQARLQDKKEGRETRLSGPSTPSHKPRLWWQDQ